MAVAIITLVILILLNAFFAASEIALVGLNDNKIKKMADNGDKKAKQLYNLISKPSRFLSTIQIGITLAGFLASAFAADFFAGPLANFLHNIGVPLAINVLNTLSLITVTLLLSYFTLVFGELVPKQLALHRTEQIANIAATPLTLLFKIFYPVVKFLTFSTNMTVRLFGVDPNAQSEEATEEEIRILVDVGGERGTIQVSEKLMINNIFEFNDKTASDISTHRTEMSVIPIDASLADVVRFVNIDLFTRYPVFKGDIDNIVGILHVKDLLKFLDSDTKEPFDLRKLIRKPYFVLEAKKLDVLFTEMQQNNVHIAIVVDEYGGTEGLVTIEDVIEEIVGEITSELAGPEEEEIKEIAPNQYIVDGISHLYKLEDFLHVQLPSDDFDTLNGFLINQLGYIPSSNERPVVNYKNLQFEVMEVDENRIEKVLVTVIDNEKKASNEE